MIKKYINVAIIFVSLISMVSCRNSEPSMESAGEYMAQYLSNNYEKGDTLLYTTLDHQVDTFVVTLSQCLMCVEGTKRLWPSEKIVSVFSDVYLKGNGFSVEVNLVHLPDGKTGCRYSFYQIGQNLDGNEGMKILSIEYESLVQDFYFTNLIGQSCHLRRNEGIIDFTDGNGNRWIKK